MFDVTLRVDTTRLGISNYISGIMRPVENKNLKYVFEKLFSTIDTYKEKYPELMYLEKEINNTYHNAGNKIDKLENLIKLCGWLKGLVMQYYVFRIIQHGLERDIVNLQQGNFKKSKNKLYLEFAVI